MEMISGVFLLLGELSLIKASFFDGFVVSLVIHLECDRRVPGH